MTSFFTSSNSSVAQTLGSNEVGYVAAGASLYNGLGSAVTFNGTAAGPSALTVLGSVVSSASTLVTSGTLVSDIRLVVGSAGSVVGMGGVAAFLGQVSTALNINNGGLINGYNNAISAEATSAAATFTLLNTGTISNSAASGTNTAAIRLHTISATFSVANITNHGDILSASATGIISSGKVVLDNFGTIAASSALGTATALSLSAFGDIVNNLGTITGNVETNVGADFVENRGTIFGNVRLGNDSDTFRNIGGFVTGIIDGGAGFDLYEIDRSDLRVRDSSGGGSIFASCDYSLKSTFATTLTLTSADNHTGTGTYLDELMVSNEGNDTLIANSGNDSLFGGEGDDVLFAGRGNDTANGGLGNDTITMGLGNDTVVLSFDDDVLFGGGGTDTLIVDVNYIGVANINFATGTATLGALPDGVSTFSGFENLLIEDQFFSVANNDTITGSGGDNSLSAGRGNDSILGGAGNDTLIGASGADVLNGGAGNDTFLFKATFDSAVGFGDTLVGFQAGVDVIDLSQIDAVPATVPPNEAFTFIGAAAFSGTGAQVRYTVDTVANTGLIEVRLDGDATTDMVIHLNTAAVLTAGNFIL